MVRRRLRVLIVEDERIVSMMLHGLVSRAGHEVLPVAARGAEALRIAREHRPDLVIMDVQLQGPPDGVATARAIRSFLAVPLVFVSGYLDAECREAMADLDDCICLEKPAMVREIVRILDRLAAQQPRRAAES